MTKRRQSRDWRVAFRYPHPVDDPATKRTRVVRNYGSGSEGR
ncbi:MAG: hypothetical protein ACRDQ7_09310 [Haloechinothrix sp.]